ncbi:MAG: class I SAM-dependent methyltransferase [Ferruginibacter sp.]
MPTIEKTIPSTNWINTDRDFNQLYPVQKRVLADRHWTPVSIAKKAADFLAAENHVNVLDIGSGVGKFCLTAAYHKPNAFFCGVEQRASLIKAAETANKSLGLKNVSFIHGNFTQVDFRNFDHFYFYNAFYENIAGTEKIDESIDYSSELYNYYSRILLKLLEQRPAGTRLATYHSLEDEVPEDYHVVGSDADNLLKYWIKV